MLTMSTENPTFLDSLKETASLIFCVAFLAGIVIAILWSIYANSTLLSEHPVAFPIGFLVVAIWLTLEFSTQSATPATSNTDGSAAAEKSFWSRIVNFVLVVGCIFFLGSIGGAFLAAFFEPVNKDYLEECAPGVPTRFC